MIYKRNKTYHYDFILESTRYRGSTHLTNEQDALDYEATMRVRIIREGIGAVSKKPAPTFRDFAKRFQSYLETHFRTRASTLRFYMQQLAYILNFAPMADARLDKIDEALIEEFVEHRSKQVSVVTVNHGLRTLRRALRLAHKWGVIGRVPQFQIDTKSEPIREYVLSHKDQPRYIAASSQPLKDTVILMIDSGLRIGEALRLQWTDIRDGFVFVRQGKSKNARRHVPLTAAAIKMLRERRESVKSLYVFPSPNGEPYLPTSLAHQHAAVRETLKLPTAFVLHSLRHTYGTRLGEAGADAFTIMRVMGHFSVTVSERYVHPSKKAITLAVSQLEAANQAAVAALKAEAEKEAERLLLPSARQAAHAVA